MVARETVTAKEFRAIARGRQLPTGEPGQSKYRNRKKPVDGIVFDSEREAARYVELKEAEREGRISKLRRQVAYALNVGDECVGKIIVDFVYERDGETVYEDVKSDPTMTPLFRWKARHFLAQYGQEIEVVK